jgi:HAD superfamily hydrolase (TIGR01484 family)
MKSVDEMLIFDVDGVITDPQKKQVTEIEILDHIAKKLEMGQPVALNTGRSLVWMIERVINLLLKKIKNHKSLQIFFASGEKGSTWITFDENGKMKHHKDETIIMPFSLQAKIKHLIESKFSRSMFYDDTKETMISTEMKDGYSVEEYSKQQKVLTDIFQKIVNRDDPHGLLKIDPTTIATDIENKRVGKGFAIERILKWLTDIDIEPQKFITFGDSLSDLPMSQMLHKKGKTVEFVYVGKNQINNSYPFPILHTKNKYGQGTAEALQTL